MKTYRHKKDGFILITVLMIIAILTALLLRSNLTSRNNLYSANSFTQQATALNCARGGLNIAMAAINKNPEITTNITLQKMIAGESSFVIKPGKCTVTVIPENGKLNINTLRQKNGKLDRTRIDQFLRLIDLVNDRVPQSQQLSYGLAPAIIDWTDPDSEVTVLPFIKRDNRGAENNDYQNIEPKRTCKNEPFDTVDELLLLKDITAEMIYPAAKADMPKLTELLTVFGDGKIDINAAPAMVIEAISESITETVAKRILQQRQQRPFATIQEVKGTTGLSDDAWLKLSRTITVSPEQRYYTIIATGMIDDTEKTITGIVKRNTTNKTMDLVLIRETP